MILAPLLIHVPTLTIPPHEAIVSCMFSYMFVSISGMFAYSRHSSINWRECAFLLYSSTPAAFAAAASLNMFSEWLLKMILYSVMLISSLFSLRTLVRAARESHTQIHTSDEGEGERKSFDSGFRVNNSSPLDCPPALASSEVGRMNTDEVSNDDGLSSDDGNGKPANRITKTLLSFALLLSFSRIQRYSLTSMTRMSRARSKAKSWRSKKKERTR